MHIKKINVYFPDKMRLVRSILKSYAFVCNLKLVISLTLSISWISTLHILATILAISLTVEFKEAKLYIPLFVKSPVCMIFLIALHKSLIPKIGLWILPLFTKILLFFLELLLFLL